MYPVRISDRSIKKATLLRGEDSAVLAMFFLDGSLVNVVCVSVNWISIFLLTFSALQYSFFGEWAFFSE